MPTGAPDGKNNNDDRSFHSPESLLPTSEVVIVQQTSINDGIGPPSPLAQGYTADRLTITSSQQR
jgi:hypothetical protein